MATWHQLRRQVPLWDAVKWTVVDDPPGNCRSCILFNTEREAVEYIARRVALQTEAHCYVLPPYKG